MFLCRGKHTAAVRNADDDDGDDDDDVVRLLFLFYTSRSVHALKSTIDILGHSPRL